MTESKIRRFIKTEILNSGSTFTRSLVVVLTIALILGVFYTHLIIWPQQFREGQIVPYTIYAPIAFSYTDSQKLKDLSGSVGEDEKIWVIDPAVKQEATARFEQFKSDFMELRDSILSSETEDESAFPQISALADEFKLDPRLIDRFLGFHDEQLSQIFITATVSLDAGMSTSVTEGKIRQLKQGGLPELSENPSTIYVYFLKPNLVKMVPEINEEIRLRARVEIEKGSVIVSAGQAVDSRMAEQLDELKQHLALHRSWRFMGIVILLLMLILLWFLYLKRFSPRMLAQTGILAQIGMLCLAFTTLGLLIGRLQFNYFYFGVTFAVAALAVLVVMVYDAMFALYLALGVGLLLSVALRFEANMMLYTLAGALLPAIALCSESNRRSQVLFALSMGLLNAALAFTVLVVSVQTQHWQIFLIAFLGGFLAAVLALGLLPVMETVSTQLTPGKLNDLANQENELLKRLKREAHGTYAHSNMVADLAEEACRAIGARWMRAKVGALYHDIGKLKRPGFFAENIHDLTKNPHDGLPPETSAKILKDHVTDGLAMAKEAHLPVELHQFIAEHHGNYLIKYFYFKALEAHRQDPESNVEPQYQDFSYDGPLPQDKESGVVMLADITEAVTRARADAAAPQISRIIAEIINEKIGEGQLINSGLTIGDLDKIKLAFENTLAAQRHQRITYPGKGPAPMQFHFLEREIPNGKDQQTVGVRGGSSSPAGPA